MTKREQGLIKVASKHKTNAALWKQQADAAKDTIFKYGGQKAILEYAEENHLEAIGMEWSKKRSYTNKKGYTSYKHFNSHGTQFGAWKDDDKPMPVKVRMFVNKRDFIYNPETHDFDWIGNLERRAEDDETDYDDDDDDDEIITFPSPPKEKIAPKKNPSVKCRVCETYQPNTDYTCEMSEYPTGNWLEPCCWNCSDEKYEKEEKEKLEKMKTPKKTTTKKNKKKLIVVA